ncbi:FAD-binding domain-containing protein [Mollisia scopiformis]|uniref:FAD-binding domain-containing protein n=1 Tax=Mollisia scopiformis TaxID=149040 RepID=A0A194X3Y1_MOLSC|nr:FAD-binding domain-containing protein [Mollisia scopiformis]KUJ14527.1 FAD-binding domain-containing protein [Mollisia scopiformis]
MSATTDSVIQVAKELKSSLSKNAQVLLDPLSEDFKISMKRWSEADVKTPGVIFKPASEEDVVTIVNAAIRSKVPFVPKSGGNSPWSTIGTTGWIIDLSLLTSINVDSSNETVTLQSGVQTKPLNIAVAKAGFVIQSPSGGGVGYIPFMLGGGSNQLAGMYGMACDSLVSAKVVTATKGLVIASATENEDLFWALKGAGQFFGLVVEVTMKIYKLESTITSWTCFFLESQVGEVAGVLEKVINGVDGMSPGMCAIVAPPGQTRPMLMVSVTNLRPEAEAEKFMAPLIALKPVQNIKKTVEFGNITDPSDVFGKPGLNTLLSCGLQRFDGKQFIEALDKWKKLVEEAPGAARTVFMFTWYSNEILKTIPEETTPWSHRDCPIWFMNFVAATDMDSNKIALRSTNEFIAQCQEDQKDKQKAMFPNHSREGNVKYRYRGEARLQKLWALKKTWDPEGVFTKHFLD